MSPYLLCPKVCEKCPFSKDCYDKTFFDFESVDNALSEVPVLEADIVHFMESN